MTTPEMLPRYLYLGEPFLQLVPLLAVTRASGTETLAASPHAPTSPLQIRVLLHAHSPSKRATQAARGQQLMQVQSLEIPTPSLQTSNPN